MFIFAALLLTSAIQADRLFQEGLYEDAIAIYRTDASASYRLGEAYYLTGQYGALLDLDLEEKAPLLVARAHFKQGNYQKVVDILLARTTPTDETRPLMDNALLLGATLSQSEGPWQATYLAKLHFQKGDYKKVFTEYGESSFAPQAYFSYYSYADYVRGDKAALLHLREMTKRYPDHPLSMNALYLIALDWKKDRKKLHKRDLLAAIDAFQAVESAFLRIEIPEEQRSYYASMRERATLERGFANLAVADDSSGSKKEIYLQYAAQVFRTVSPQEESLYGLAMTYVKSGRDEEAEKVLLEMKATRGYFLSRGFYERGKIAMRKKAYEEALTHFHQSELLGKKCISADEKLDIWLQESSCCRSLGRADDAMRLLSQVVNDEAISSLRLKAMVERAEIYHEQGRHDLAERQLEAVARKSGKKLKKE